MDYTTRAVQFSARFPFLTYRNPQVNFWIIANILPGLIIYWQSLLVSEAIGVKISGAFTPIIIESIILGTMNGVCLGLTDYKLESFF